MPDTVEISLPNGLKYQQPTGLFIDNTFIPASGEKFAVINPAYVCLAWRQAMIISLDNTAEK